MQTTKPNNTSAEPSVFFNEAMAELEDVISEAVN